jgi:hypothetical protein
METTSAAELLLTFFVLERARKLKAHNPDCVPGRPDEIWPYIEVAIAELTEFRPLVVQKLGG